MEAINRSEGARFRNMTDSSARCEGCDRPLDREDLFCARCGNPTSINLHAHATLVDEPVSGASQPSDISRDSSRTGAPAGAQAA